jgi:hypothetical protein
MSNLQSEFNFGANANSAVEVPINMLPPVKSPIKPEMFNGADPQPWTSDSNIANPPTNRVHDFNTPEAKEYIPVKASLSGTV